MSSRLAFQFQEMRPWARDVVLASKSEWALLIVPPKDDPFGGRVKVVARCWIGGDNVEAQYIQQGANGADLYFSRCLPFYRARPYVYAWQAANEPYNKSPEARRNLVAFTVRLAELLHSRGLRFAAGAFSNGEPDVTDPDAIAELRPVFSAGDLLLLHQYGAPTMQTEAEWYTLRHRKLHAMLGGNHSLVFIGEAGIDGGVVGQPKRGWRSFCSWESYFSQLQWYDQEVAKDDYVVGFAPFTAGANGEWADFDFSETQCRDLATYAEQEEGPVVVPQLPAERLMPILGARISQRFGENPAQYAPLKGHPGLDLACPANSSWREWHGTPVRATISGTCYALEDDSYGKHCYTFGDQADELVGHLSGHAFAGHKYVAVGEVLGWTGYTGRCIPTGGPGTHCHWGIRKHPYTYNDGFRGYSDPLLGD